MALKEAYQATPIDVRACARPALAVTAAMIEIGEHDEVQRGPRADGVGMADRGRVGRIGQERQQARR